MIDYLDQKQKHLHQQDQLQVISVSNQANQIQLQLSPEPQMNAVVQPSQSSVKYSVNPGQRTVTNLPQPQQQSGNELIGYYFGSISRETAEWILKNHANQMDGAYLLRSSGPNDDFVLSLMVNHIIQQQGQNQVVSEIQVPNCNLEVLHYKIVETEDSFVALHGQLGNEKFSTIDELIEKTQGVATKPRWPILRQSLESQILPPTYWGLTVDQVRLAILIKAKQWGFPMLSSLFQQEQRGNIINCQKMQPIDGLNVCNNDASAQMDCDPNANPLSNETIRTLIYKSLHEFQPWFHGRITREEAERRIGDSNMRDGRFLVRERDNYSYAMCISHKRTTKHYRIDVLPTGELAIQDGHKFTSLMALVSHYTLMSDGLWCALTQACPRPINNGGLEPNQHPQMKNSINSQHIRLPSIDNVRSSNLNGGNLIPNQQSLYCVPPIYGSERSVIRGPSSFAEPLNTKENDNSKNFHQPGEYLMNKQPNANHRQQSCELQPSKVASNSKDRSSNLIFAHQGSVSSLKAPIREWLQTINHRWSQLMGAKNQHQSLNSFLFGSQNPLNNHCRHGNRGHRHHRHQKCKNGHAPCVCAQQIPTNRAATLGGCCNRDLKMASKQQQMLARSNGLDPDGRMIINLNRCHNIAATKPFQNNIENHSSSVASTYCPALRQEIGTSVPMSGLGNNSYNDIPVQREIGHASTFTDDLSRQPLSQHSLTNGPVTSHVLSQMPQNSGFSLNSQSFIGSPLFVVRSMAQLDRNQSLTSNYPGGSLNGRGSTSSDSSGRANHVEVEKLISPAHSITSNMNLAHVPHSNGCNNNNMDIYGSQTSTAIVNDQQPTTSSSSSSGTHMTGFLQNQQLSNQRRLNTNQRLQNNGFHLTAAHSITNSDLSQTMLTQSVPNHGSAILCGQHAGPAFRYTNCSNDEVAYKQCSHRQPMPCGWSADDSQLAYGGTKLTSPAAMAKFVQFQDGQCLRTHRDTKSIQMAYLSSRPVNSRGIQAPRLNQSAQINGNKMPLTELNGFETLQPGRWCAQQVSSTANNGNTQNVSTKNWQQRPHQLANNSYNLDNRLNFMRSDLVDRNQRQQLPLHRFDRGITTLSQNNRQSLDENQPEGSTGFNGDEIDLMDCNEVVGDNYESFNYDPKLIKSSSIETLCGIGKEESDDEAELDNLMANCKSNTELIMSLLPCWMNGNQQKAPSNILNPVVVQTDGIDNSDASEKHHQVDLKSDDNNSKKGYDSGPILSGMMGTDLGKNNQLENMKKKHDLDELTTALLAGLTANLKASIELKNKRSGFIDSSNPACSNNNNCGSSNMKNTFDIDSSWQQAASTGRASETSPNEKWIPENQAKPTDVNPLDLISEFDTLVACNSSGKTNGDRIAR